MSGKGSKRILIAEDEKPLSNALSLKLTNEGFTIDVAADGLIVKEFISKNDYDLLLMDIMMPNLNGFSLLEDFKNEGIEIPVVVLSNLGQKSDKERVFELGAVEYFIKSEVKISEVVEFVNDRLKDKVKNWK